MRAISDLINLKGKVALVTAGSGYLGSSITETLAECGANIVVASRDKEKNCKYAQEIESKFQVKCIGCEVDITNLNKIEELKNEIIKQFGRLDILISNAAIRKSNTLDSISPEDWLYDIEQCLNGVFYLINAFIPILKETQGSIITISSMYGHIAPDYKIYNKKIYTNPPSYGAAKAGVIQLTKYLASFLSPYKIRANSISPGPFPYGLDEKEDGEFLKNLSNKNMMNRIGVPDDLKGAVLLLSTDLGKYITAQNICVDGGWKEW
ncbi:SDR family oxidoreductase [Campylobacter lari]|nr:SDR family oxidoreductase [Campylobacter lari]MCV3501498.1 SDR family oxidoreductase [Campylobacter lari]